MEIINKALDWMKANPLLTGLLFGLVALVCFVLFLVLNARRPKTQTAKVKEVEIKTLVLDEAKGKQLEDIDWGSTPPGLPRLYHGQPVYVAVRPRGNPTLTSIKTREEFFRLSPAHKDLLEIIMPPIESCIVPEKLFRAIREPSQLVPAIYGTPESQVTKFVGIGVAVAVMVIMAITILCLKG